MQQISGGQNELLQWFNLQLAKYLLPRSILDATPTRSIAANTRRISSGPK